MENNGQERDSYTHELVGYGPCKACLYEDELDSDGLCGSCNPLNEDTRVALLNLLKPVKTLSK